MYLNPRADCCSFLPTCLPAFLPTGLPVLLLPHTSVPHCLLAFISTAFLQLPQQPQPTPSAPSKGKLIFTHPHPSHLPTSLPDSDLFANTGQPRRNPVAPTPASLVIPPPPPPVPSQAGQGAGLRRPSHLQSSQRALVVPSRHTSISCSTLPIHPFVAERAAEPCALSPKARWIPEVSISEPPSTRPRAKKNSRLVPAWWHWHTRSRLFGDP